MKILIVDDEEVIRDSIANVLPWEEHCYIVLSPASSGEEALERVKQERPDIIITDIMMSGISGLQLIEALQAISYPKEIIILSGYDNFDYVQEALRKNVSDYLLKTSSPIEILTSVHRARNRLIEMKQSNQIDIQFHHNRLIKKLIFNTFQMEDILELENAFAYKRKEVFQLILIDDVIGEDLYVESEQAWNTFLFGHFIIHHEQTLIILKRESNLSDHYAYQMAKKRLVKIYESTLFISEPFTTLKDLSIMYEKVKSLIPFELLEKNKPYITTTIISERTGISHQESFKENKRDCVQIIKSGSVEQLQSWNEQLVNWLFTHPKATPKSIENYIHYLYFSVVHYVEQLYGYEVNRVKRVIVTQKLFTQPTTHLYEIFLELLKNVHAKKTSQPNYINEALLYIEKNLHKSITLQDVANEVHLHPNYLSDMLRKDCGRTFLEIVTEKRMQKAANLLQFSDRHVQEIALAVGYHDRKYFTRLFKRHYAHTPSQYRKNKLLV